MDEEYLKKLGISIARGIPQIATGMVDLAALPFTLTGLLDEKDVVGGTEYLTERGLLPPKQEGLLNETTELVSSALSPAGAVKGGLLGLGALGTIAKSKLPNATGKVMSEFVPTVETGKELIVHHNIPVDKLAKVENVGGMPVPSLAISNANNPLTNFGEITLIGNESMAVPSAKNPVYPLDAYTKRAPGIDFTIDRKSQENFTKEFADVAKQVPDGDYLLDRLFNDLEYSKDSQIMKAKFLNDAGYGLPDKNEFSKGYDYLNEINQRTRNLQPEYQDWFNNYTKSLPSKGINIKQQIFKGYSNSGKARYAEANLDNLVKEMKGGAGTEGVNYGVGNLRAIATPKFKKLNDIKASRDKIIPPSEMATVKNQVDTSYQDLLTRIKSLENQSGYGYSPEDILYEIGATKNVNKIDQFVKGAPDALKADIGLFVNKLKELPTEYFEIKPQRAMSVSEFEGAIVPSNTPKSSIEYLKQQGINNIQYYDTPEERVNLFKKFGKNMFQIGAGIGVGGLLGLQEDEQY